MVGQMSYLVSLIASEVTTYMSIDIQLLWFNHVNLKILHFIPGLYSVVILFLFLILPFMYFYFEEQDINATVKMVKGEAMFPQIFLFTEHINSVDKLTTISNQLYNHKSSWKLIWFTTFIWNTYRCNNHLFDLEDVWSIEIHNSFLTCSFSHTSCWVRTDVYKMLASIWTV